MDRWVTERDQIRLYLQILRDRLTGKQGLVGGKVRFGELGDGKVSGNSERHRKTSHKNRKSENSCVFAKNSDQKGCLSTIVCVRLLSKKSDEASTST